MITYMKNAPSGFCEFNTDVTKNIEIYFFTYIDDFIIFSTDTDSHIQRLHDVC